VAESGKPKIVIVEDEGLIAADLEARLKVAGYLVPGTADSAERALDVIRRTSPDLVLMDIRLKGNIDGIDIANQVHEQLDVPVVYLTAYDDRQTLDRASHTQAFGYIKKPVASASLRGSIEMAISKHRYERKLRAQRDWADVNFRAVPYAVLVTDGQGQITYLNALAEQLTGVRIDQALGRPSKDLLRLFDSQSGAPVQDYAQVAMLQGETVPLPEGICLRPDEAHSYAIEGSVAPRWHNRRVEGTVIALADVTRFRIERAQAQQEEKQDALLRLAEGIVDNLPGLSKMAEESPDLLKEQPIGSQSRAEVVPIRRAENEAFRLTSRLGAFLHVPEVHLECVELGGLLRPLEAAWTLVQPPIRLKLDPEPLAVQADPRQLTRALTNILLHARSQMRSGSALAIEVTGAALEPVSIRIQYATVQENAASMERVFEPSWSGSSPDLHVVFRVIKKMGGRIAAWLEHGDQATFKIDLLRVESAAAGALVPKPDQPACLFVDPNAKVRRVLDQQ
jgi:AmiR/NasT family two-component response regulator/signal transduction histidine kinase